MYLLLLSIGLLLVHLLYVLDILPLVCIFLQMICNCCFAFVMPAYSKLSPMKVKLSTSPSGFFFSSSCASPQVFPFCIPDIVPPRLNNRETNPYELVVL